MSGARKGRMTNVVARLKRPRPRREVHVAARGPR